MFDEVAIEVERVVQVIVSGRRETCYDTCILELELFFENTFYNLYVAHLMWRDIMRRFFQLNI